MSRSQNVKKNILFGGISKIIALILPFITRTIFIYLLGEEYLGVGGLFSSILSLLNMSELGLSSVVVFSLYKPIADKDNDDVASLLNFYKFIYTIIASFILVAGLCVLPFLGKLVNSALPLSDLRIYYVLYLLNQVASYLYIWKSSLIEANQKQYVVIAAKTLFTFITQVAQILVLLLTRNFILYLCAALLCTILHNLYVSYQADKMFPEVKAAHVSDIGKERKKTIFSDVGSYFSYKMGGVFLNSTDSLYISRMINTRTVGYYSNYQSLSTALTSLTSFVYQAIIHSVGNFNVNSSQKEKKQLFDELCLMFSIVAVVVLTGFFCVSSDLVQVWIGSRFVVDDLTVFAISLNMYLPIILYPVWIFRRTTGIFRKTRSILLYAGVVNLILSYFFGKAMGLAGILLATSVSRVLTSFWFEPVILFRNIFPDYHVISYFMRVLKGLLVSGVSILIIRFITSLLPFSGLLKVLFEIAIAGSISLILAILANVTDPSFGALKKIGLKMLKR